MRIDAIIAVAALVSAALLRYGHYRLALRAFVSVLLVLVLFNYAKVGAQQLLPTPLPIIILAFGGLLIGRRDLWCIYATLLLSLTLSMLSDNFHFSGAEALSIDAMDRMASIAGLYTMSAILFDGAIRALREGIDEARARAAELTEVNQALAQEIDEHKEAQRRLLHTQKLDAVNRLAAGVAHDFDNQLSVILGYAMRREQMAEQGTAELERGLESIERVTRQALDSTARLLAFSRKDEIRTVRFDINAALREVEPMLRQLFDPSTRIHMQLEPTAQLIDMDRSQFDVMVMNIAANARDAMQTQARGVFSIATRLQARNTVVLSLGDSGTGIAPDVLPRIFDAFFTTKPTGHGTGLGLAAVADIVRGAGGTVQVNNHSGGGCVFTLSLPCQPRSA